MILEYLAVMLISMTGKIFILFICVFSFLTAFSQELDQEQLERQKMLEWREDYGPGGFEEEVSLEDKARDVLYEALFPEILRKEKPAETYKSYRVHLKDSDQYFPYPQNVVAGKLRNVKRIKGTMTYVGIFKKRYEYDVLTTESGERIILVKVNFKNATNQDIAKLTPLFVEAENIWNRKRVATDFPYRFAFRIEANASRAHFSVRLQDSTRGPYDTFWGRDWPANVLAHELGHMMGLGDEYKTLSGTLDCYLGSMMCGAWYGQPMDHHYYFILRRFVKRP